MKQTTKTLVGLLVLLLVAGAVGGVGDCVRELKRRSVSTVRPAAWAASRSAASRFAGSAPAASAFAAASSTSRRLPARSPTVGLT